MKLYTSSSVDKLINNYLERGGDLRELSAGVLGHGKIVLTGDGLKTAVIEEVYINEWSSGHKVRFYNETPAKYL
jgi:hypothetical protein